MNFFERILVFLGLAEETEEYEEEEEVLSSSGEEQETQTNRTSRKKRKQPRQDNSVVPLHGGSNSSKIKLYLFAPGEYEEVQDIAKYLKDGYPVLVNLERLSNVTAKQLIDFVSGTVFALDGNLHKIGQHIFLFSPPNVDIEGSIETTSTEDQEDYEIEQKTTK